MKAESGMPGNNESSPSLEKEADLFETVNKEHLCQCH